MDNTIKLLGVNDVMSIYGVGRKKAMELMDRSGLMVPRHKGQRLLVHTAAFDEWMSRAFKIKEEKR